MSKTTQVEQAGDRGGTGVLVSGASFAGLATAWWMHRLGYAVTVVEVAEGLRWGGTPVNIREGVLDVVRRMGLLERIKSQALPLRPVVFLDATGEPLRQSQDHEEQEPDEEYEIERDALLQMLFDEVKEHVTFQFADRIATLEESGDEVAVGFASGTTQTFSFVFGCDGTHSGVRKLCFGEEARFGVYLGTYFSLTLVDKLLLEENTSRMFSVPGRTVMLNAYNGKTDIAFCFSSEAEIAYDRRQQGEQKRMVRRHFADGGWRVAELLDEMMQSDNFYFDKLCQIRMSAWTKGRVALVGDAAYGPSPAAGMGGSVAILGAAALGEAFEQYPEDFRQAFQAYDRGLRPTVEAIQAQAVEIGLKLFLPDTEEAIAERNLQLGLLPA